MSLNKSRLSHGVSHSNWWYHKRFTFPVHRNFTIPIQMLPFSILWIKAAVCYTETLNPIKQNYLNTNTVIFTELRNLFVVRFENRKITTKTQNCFPEHSNTNYCQSIRAQKNNHIRLPKHFPELQVSQSSQGQIDLYFFSGLQVESFPKTAAFMCLI